MSGLFNEASLVLVPSGYKSGKVYSEVPTDGDGDLTFTRASSATRVNSDGLIESPRTNLVLYSEEFDNAYWNKALGTITANATTAPDGTLTADLFTKTSGVNTVSQLGSSTSVYTTTGANTLSVYIKPNVGNSVILRLDNGGNTANFAFNFTTKTFSSSGANVISSSFDELLNGWFRLKVTGNVTSTSWSLTHCLLFDNPTNDSMYIWGAQLETGDIATDYIPTTTTAVSVGMTSNVPRLDYSQGSCPALLLEGQRTNLALYSEQFDNANWNFYFGTQVANTTETLDPSGYYGAEKVIMGSGNQAVYRQSIGGLTNGATYTLSLYIKQGSGVTAFLDISDTTSTVNITPTGEWVRYTKTGVWNTSANYIDLEFRGTSGSAYCYLWGAQLELGSYATSYIPTTSATVTRLADRVNRSGLGLTDSTFVINFRPLNGTVEVLDFQKSGGARMFYIAINSVRFVTFNSVSGGTIGAIGSAITLNETCKLGFTLNASTSNVTVFINGLKIGTYATDITTFDRFRELETFGFAQGTKVEQILIFPSVLTDAQCIELTTL